jgi:4-hydroxy-tetrahydrodipicolinate synthase
VQHRHVPLPQGGRGRRRVLHRAERRGHAVPGADGRGAKGGIVVTATLLPRTWQRLYELSRDGRTADAIALHRELIPLLDLAFAETNPGPLKSVLDLIGAASPRVLDPLLAPGSELQRRLRAEVDSRLAFEASLARG